jgi:hypothetical protein
MLGQNFQSLRLLYVNYISIKVLRNKETVKTTTRCHCVPIRMAKVQSTDTTRNWRGYGATGSLVHCWGMQNGATVLGDNLACYKATCLLP